MISSSETVLDEASGNRKGVWFFISEYLVNPVRIYFSRFTRLITFLIFAVSYLLAYVSAINLSVRHGAALWFPDSVLLCTLLSSPRRSWWIYIVATLPLRLAVSISSDTPLWFLGAAFANDSLKALLAAGLIRRLVAGRGVRFDSLRDFWMYLLASAVVAPALSGVGGAASWVLRGQTFWPTWRNWFLGDALVNIVLTPLLLGLATGWRKLGGVKPRRWIEGFAVGAGLVVAVWLPHRLSSGSVTLAYVYTYAPVAFLVLAAVRFGPMGASASLSIMSMLSVAAAAARQAAVVVPTSTDGVTSIQVFMIVLAIPIISLSVLVRQQQKTERSLRESEQRFRNIADTAPVMIWLSGPDKLFTFFNRTWLEFTGRLTEQEIGDGWSSGLHPEDRQRFYESFRSSFDARQSFRLECRLRRADGEYRSVLCSGSPRFESDGSFLGYIGSVTDTSDLQSEERFRQLSENSDQIFWVLDVDANKMIYVSAAFEKIWDRGSAPLYRNRNWVIDSVHSEDQERFLALCGKARSEAVEEFYRIIRPDDSIRWIRDRAFPVRDFGSRAQLVAGIAEDITAQREMEGKIRQAHKMQAVGRLAGGIAHDFNNILTGIIGYSSMLITSPQVHGQTRESAQAILRSGQRAAALIAQLLAFSRNQPLEPKALDLNVIVGDMERMLARIIGEQTRIVTILQPGLSLFEADLHQIENVIMNLALNARDAMPHGGKLTIETRDVWVEEEMAQRPEIRPGHYVMMSVTDTGVGMDKKTQERVFEPFFTTKEVGKGTGLGLAIVYSTVEESGGHILLDSQPGRGTTLKIYFPRATSDQPNQVSHEPTDPLHGSETILLAEDEPTVRHLVRTGLEQYGYRVLDGTDCHTVLATAEAYRGTLDLLLTDLSMPDMNGYQLAEKVVGLRPGIHVLYMSGYHERMMEAHSTIEEAANFIGKPFAPDSLARKVRHLLDGSTTVAARGHRLSG